MAKNGFTTTIVHSDRRSGIEHGAIHQPMHASTEYAFADARELAAVFQGKAGFTYARQGTPTTAALEAKITQMEEGVGTVTFASGMAALAATFFSLLKSGDHLISSQHIFGNTNSLLGTLAGLGVDISFVDATDLASVQAAWRPDTRMVFTETLANPGTQVADLAGIGNWCRDKGLVYVVDNTLTSPLLFKPKSAHATLVVNSLSKHIGGHGNGLGGAVTNTGLFDWSAYPNIAEPYRKGAPTGWGLTQIKKKGLRDMGGTLSSDVAHRLGAGAETLVLRMNRICANALALAQHLESHSRVMRVHYPGLDSHAQHERAVALFGARFGGLMGIELDPAIDVFDFLNRLRVLALATHLGDNRTLVLPMAQTIYYEMGPERRAQMGISDTFLRVSIGIEDIEDLIGDFDQALAQS
ncbi:cystathionine gamma-synthase family protein [Allopusillimonas soli]|uniref:Cystathionine gamma-synthase family protein n=1 Tax=Allopusillimonas soli TaxID=659016 RepID=A0A853FA13_9BURK|nr:cystathionine gamma-synthase family protein [Allopusillimonas soli]NYT35431.1 cystathionine gamma-synthase family protein [Allopusillimonas soli]TEA75846.1 cystathionine gamma-synthase family protein [Allopusillimonas soli]